eukprot:gene15921-7255_t
MSPERLEHLIQLVGPLIAKKKCNSRVPIPVAERIVITLRYLATGDSQQSQAFNFRTDNAFYVPAGFVDAEDETGEIIPSSWRCKTSDETSALKNIGRAGSNNYKADAKAMRENFMTYFNSVSGSVSWQVKHVTSTGATLPSTSTNC